MHASIFSLTLEDLGQILEDGHGTDRDLVTVFILIITEAPVRLSGPERHQAKLLHLDVDLHQLVLELHSPETYVEPGLVLGWSCELLRCHRRRVSPDLIETSSERLRGNLMLGQGVASHTLRFCTHTVIN